MTIGECIKHHRKAKGLSQNELAKKIGIATNSLSRYEIGERNISWEMLSRIAEALDMSAIDLTNNADIWGEPRNISFDNKVDENAPLPTKEQILESLEQLKELLSEAENKITEAYAQDENNVLICYRSLNKTGKKEALKRMIELSEIPAYTTPDSTNETPTESNDNSPL